MSVVIDQLEQVALPSDRSPGAAQGAGDSGRGTTAAATEAQVIQLLHRAAVREARLWAD
jgi:hypothetical protein